MSFIMGMKYLLGKLFSLLITPGTSVLNLLQKSYKHYWFDPTLNLEPLYLSDLELVHLEARPTLKYPKQLSVDSSGMPGGRLTPILSL